MGGRAYLKGSDEAVLILLTQFVPARDERGVEQVARQGRVSLRQRPAAAQGRRRGLFQEIDVEPAQPLVPVRRRASLRGREGGGGWTG